MHTVTSDLDEPCVRRRGLVSSGPVLPVDARGTNHRIAVAPPKHIHRQLAAQGIIGVHQECQAHPRVQIPLQGGQDLSQTIDHTAFD